MENSERKKIFVLAVCGPTASGKTELGVRLAKRLDGEIISADSMQIYKGMEIATAKPAEREMEGIPHHLMNFLNPDTAFSVADYVSMAHGCIKDIDERGKLPIVVGGTGLYISSLMNNLRFDDTGSDLDFREEMRRFAEENGNSELWEKLRSCDPEAAAKLHPNNLNRIIRALEVYRLSGATITEAQEKSRAYESPYSAYYLMPDYSREELYGRINARVDKMLDMGLLEEAKDFFTHKDYVTAAQAIGYKELKPFLDGEKTLEECVERLKQATRNYAKRQLTWFKKIEGLHRLSVSGTIDDSAILKLSEAVNDARNKKIKK